MRLDRTVLPELATASGVSRLNIDRLKACKASAQKLARWLVLR
jgi:hypothetical protein